MSSTSPLSVVDLPLFFSEHHHELGSQLDSFTLVGDEAGTILGQLAGAGLLEWLVPRAGAALDVRALCLIRERLGAISAAADSIFAVHGLGTTPLRLAAQTSETTNLLEQARRGTATFGFALTEPDAGSDVASMKTVAVASEQTVRLTGDKTLISNVGIASHYTVFANADPSAGRRGISAYIVEHGAAGLLETPMSVICDHPIGSLRFDDCAASPLGATGEGFRLAMQTLDRFRVTVGAAAVGMARAAFDAAFAHVQTRVQFGSPLADKQLVQAALADMVTELDAARLLVYRAAHALDQRQVATQAVAQAKLFATEAAQRIIDRAVQLFGGRGVASGELVETLYRAIRPLRIYEGASDIQKLIIYKQLTKR